MIANGYPSFPVRAEMPGRCAAGRSCVLSLPVVKPGEMIVAVDEASHNGIRWAHVECRANELADEYDRLHSRPAPARQMATRRPPAEAHQNASESLSQPRERLSTLPVGRYTVTPADERQHVVIDVEHPAWGDFPASVRQVSVHGAFAVRGKDGLSEFRSWLAFALIRDGRLVPFKKTRTLLTALTATLSEEDLHTRARVESACKATRLMLDAPLTDLLSYGKAYAAREGHCFVCRRPLIDRESQERGIGPVCLKRMEQEAGA